MNKLTYYHICNYLASGESWKIPGGYNIKYVPCPPDDGFDETVDKSKIKIFNGNFPQPDYIKIKGSNQVCVPPPPYDDEFITKQPAEVDFGEVIVQTEFQISELKFLYTKDRLQEVNDRMKEIVDYIYSPGYIDRRRFIVDIGFSLPLEIVNICECTPRSVSYPLPGQAFDGLAAVDFDHRWFSRIPI